MSYSIDECIRELAWFSFRFKLPLHWELTGHTADPLNGKLEFSDREGFTCRIHWRQATKKPDFEIAHRKWFEEFVKKNRREEYGSMPKIQGRKLKDFEIHWIQEQEPFWASIFSEEANLVLDLYFPEMREGHFSDSDWKSFLESFTPNTVQDDRQRWSAWGLKSSIPSNFELEEVISYPANVKFTFESKKHHKIRVHRWGLISELLKDYNLAQFYRSALKLDRAVIDEVKSRSVQGMEGVEIHFRERGSKKMDKLLGSWWQGRGLCWIDEKEKRIYAAEWIAPRKVIVNMNWEEELLRIHNY